MTDFVLMMIYRKNFLICTPIINSPFLKEKHKTQKASKKIQNPFHYNFRGWKSIQGSVVQLPVSCISDELKGSAPKCQSAEYFPCFI